MGCNCNRSKPQQRKLIEKPASVPSPIGKWIYERVGNDIRPIELLPDGIITGGGGLEQKWSIVDSQLVIGGSGMVIMALDYCDGNWVGKWLSFEQFEIKLSVNVPVQPPSE